MCVQLPKRLTGIHNSGGNPAGIDCSGAFSLDFNVRIRSGVDPNLAPGALVDGQFWYRDPADSIGIGLTEAIEFVVQP